MSLSSHTQSADISKPPHLSAIPEEGMVVHTSLLFVFFVFHFLLSPQRWSQEKREEEAAGYKAKTVGMAEPYHFQSISLYVPRPDPDKESLGDSDILGKCLVFEQLSDITTLKHPCLLLCHTILLTLSTQHNHCVSSLL